MRRLLKSIQTTVVILTTVKLLQWLTNPLRSNTLVTRCTYFSDFSIAQNTCGSQSLTSTKVAASYFVLWFPHRQIFTLWHRFLFWEIKKKSHGARSEEYVGCCTCGIACLIKKYSTSWYECAGTLLWWICEFPDDHSCGRLRRIAPRRRCTICK